MLRGVIKKVEGGWDGLSIGQPARYKTDGNNNSELWLFGRFIPTIKNVFVSPIADSWRIFYLERRSILVLRYSWQQSTSSYVNGASEINVIAILSRGRAAKIV